MDIKSSALQPSTKGPEEHFAGNVQFKPLFQSTEPGRVLGALVVFEPGARTAWHTHPLGQSLVVTDGRGWVQCWGGPKKEILPGDVISSPPGEKHWHGATTTTGMTHLAIHEHLDGKYVDWLEQVSDEQYKSGLEPE